MSKFKVGDILIGKAGNGYVYTTQDVKVRVESIIKGGGTNDIMVKVLADPTYQAGPWAVESSKFTLHTRAAVVNLRDLKKKVAPRFVKAVVVEGRSKLPTGKIVILDLATVKGLDSFHENESAFVQVAGQGIDFYTSRFEIDPTLRVAKKELINA